MAIGNKPGADSAPVKHAAAKDNVPEATASAVILLRSYSLRVTPQRLLLVDVARSLLGHFSADDVYERVRAVYPGVSKVSVYRGLETLRELGLVTCTALGSHAAQYEWTSTGRHHHLICSCCGYQQNFPDEEMNDLRERLRTRYGFHASIDHHAIWGLCKTCAERAASQQAPGRPSPAAAVAPAHNAGAGDRC